MCWLVIDTQPNGPDIPTIIQEIDRLTGGKAQEVAGGRVNVNCAKGSLGWIKDLIEEAYPGVSINPS